VAGGPLSFVPEPVMPSCPSLHARRTALVQPGAAYVGPGAAAPNWPQISRMAAWKPQQAGSSVPSSVARAASLGIDPAAVRRFGSQPGRGSAHLGLARQSPPSGPGDSAVAGRPWWHTPLLTSLRRRHGCKGPGGCCLCALVAHARKRCADSDEAAGPASANATRGCSDERAPVIAAVRAANATRE
jgi:hypothetical protein